MSAGPVLDKAQLATRKAVGLFLILLTAIIWIVTSFISESLVRATGTGGSAKVPPFLLTYLATSLFILYLPFVHAKRWLWPAGDPAAADGRSYVLTTESQAVTTQLLSCGACNADMAASGCCGHVQPTAGHDTHTAGSSVPSAARAVAPGADTTEQQAMSAALWSTPLWFLAQWTFNLSLALTSVTSNTILSSMSSLFTFGLSVALLGERFTLKKLACILACILGTALVTLSDLKAAEAAAGLPWPPPPTVPAPAGGARQLLAEAAGAWAAPKGAQQWVGCGDGDSGALCGGRGDSHSGHAAGTGGAAGPLPRGRGGAGLDWHLPGLGTARLGLSVSRLVGGGLWGTQSRRMHAGGGSGGSAAGAHASVHEAAAAARSGPAAELHPHAATGLFHGVTAAALAQQPGPTASAGGRAGSGSDKAAAGERRRRRAALRVTAPAPAPGPGRAARGQGRPVTAAVLGDMLVLASGALYAAYTVVMRLKLPGEEAGHQVASFFGYMGLFTTVLLAPVVVLLMAAQSINVSAIPRDVYWIILLEGLLDYVLSDYLWARAVMLVGPTVATLSLSVQIPLAGVAELLGGDPPGWARAADTVAMTLSGTLLILLGFVVINLGGGGGGNEAHGRMDGNMEQGPCGVPASGGSAWAWALQRWALLALNWALGAEKGVQRRQVHLEGGKDKDSGDEEAHLVPKNPHPPHHHQEGVDEAHVLRLGGGVATRAVREAVDGMVRSSGSTHVL